MVFYDWLPRWLFISSDLTTFFDIRGRFPYTGELDTLYYFEQWWTFKVVNMVWHWPDKLILIEVKLRSILVFHQMLCNLLLPWYRWWINHLALKKDHSLSGSKHLISCWQASYYFHYLSWLHDFVNTSIGNLIKNTC